MFATLASHSPEVFQTVICCIMFLTLFHDIDLVMLLLLLVLLVV